VSRAEVGPQGRAFLNRLKALGFVDGHRLPELGRAQQAQFVGDPAHFLVRASDAHQAAILHELGLDRAGPEDLGAEQKRRIMDARVDPRWELTIGDALCGDLGDGAAAWAGLTPEHVLDAVIREVLLCDAVVVRG
jgi:hypothetical protein